MNTREDWWSDFFRGPFGDLQVQGSAHLNAEAERDVERIIRCVGPAPKKVLDAPCGAGRHSLELARRGYQVLGTDFNPAVLDVARARARAESLEAEFRQQDLRELDTRNEFDAVICIWTSIGYFSDEDNEKALLNLVRAVKPGGYLILDTAVLESLCRVFSERGWSWWGDEPERVRVCEERTWNAPRSRMEVTWTFIRNQREETHQTSIRIYTCHELVQILCRGGISTFDCQGQDGQPYRISSPRLWLEGQKTG